MEAGGRVTFRCVADSRSGARPPRLRWTRQNGGRLQSNARDDGGGTLVIYGVGILAVVVAVVVMDIVVGFLVVLNVFFEVLFVGGCDGGGLTVLVFTQPGTGKGRNICV